MSSYTVRAVAEVPEIAPGDDLAALVAARTDLEDGDIVVVTSKVVSKAEGRVRRLAAGEGREAAIGPETDRVVARRGPTSIVRTRHGLVMAAAGVDASNTEPGTVVLLPVDPDASARRFRARVREETGATVGVVVTDTSGRAWRNGQTDIAIGAAGLIVLDDHAGRTDPYGNALLVTAPAVADELASAAELAGGKLSRCPVVVVRGLGHLVLPPGQDGPGATALVRDEATDMFGYGAREAVVHAVAEREGPGADRLPGAHRGFGAPASAAELATALEGALGPVQAEVGTAEPDGPVVTVRAVAEDLRAAGRLEARAVAVARAHGWREGNVESPGGTEPVVVLRFGPRGP